ncbi:conserved hypothetical protein, partial [Trichinella spiralis]|uniref:hypothetical protein n=1 Tax=Trichinella spiralis TaxID=6334 RepID=UPI0001EFE461
MYPNSSSLKGKNKVQCECGGTRSGKSNAEVIERCKKISNAMRIIPINTRPHDNFEISRATYLVVLKTPKILFSKSYLSFDGYEEKKKSTSVMQSLIVNSL